MSYPFWRLAFVAGDPRLAMSAFRSQRVWLIWFSNEIWRCGCRLLINRMTLTSNLLFTLPSAKAGGNHFLGELRCFVFYSAVPNGILCFFSLIRSPELGLTYLHSIHRYIHPFIRTYVHPYPIQAWDRQLREVSDKAAEGSNPKKWRVDPPLMGLLVTMR